MSCFVPTAQNPKTFCLLRYKTAHPQKWTIIIKKRSQTGWINDDAHEAFDLNKSAGRGKQSNTGNCPKHQEAPEGSRSADSLGYIGSVSPITSSCCVLFFSCLSHLPYIHTTVVDGTHKLAFSFAVFLKIRFKFVLHLDGNALIVIIIWSFLW